MVRVLAPIQPCLMRRKSVTGRGFHPGAKRLDVLQYIDDPSLISEGEVTSAVSSTESNGRQQLMYFRRQPAPTNTDTVPPRRTHVFRFPEFHSANAFAFCVLTLQPSEY